MLSPCVVAEPVHNNGAYGMPIPVQAIAKRLRSAMDAPSWAAYLPAGVHFEPVEGEKHFAAPQLSVVKSTPMIVPEPVKPTVPSVAGSVWKLAREQSGCREVQRALQEAVDEGTRLSLAEELRGHAWEALRCPHANHVLQKCISTMRPESSQFIIDELMEKGSGAALQVARHRYGCRILERLLEKCSSEQVSSLVNELVADSVALALHPFGKYVMHHLLEYCSKEQRRNCIDRLAQHISKLGRDPHATAVIGKALQHGSSQDQAKLARALLSESGLLAEMARGEMGSWSRVHATLAVQALEDSREKEIAYKIVATEVNAMKAASRRLSLLSAKE
eukprot:TRINITY_DN15795_c1_g1_i2.p1 TRINITY_DN15795_c1_g1~~TRINITY_DN15795_c1_g1_i2.p1  ORF type:complete len:334 (+),score=66.47 TRINITY_DN15795_c1_g1_i2:70-1071(+)